MRENTSLEDGATVALDSIDAIPEPVFVDDTGKRRRRIRLAFYAVGAVSLTYAGLVAVSLLGGPLKPESLIPFPQTFNRPAAGAPSPMTGEAARLAKKTGRGGATPHPSGKPGTANPANAIVVPPTQPAANGTPGPGATPTPEATPTPTPAPTLTPTPSPNPPPPPTDPAPTDTNTAPAAGGQGGGGAQTGQGGQPQDTNTGTVVPIETTPVAAPNPAPTDTTTATATATGTEPSGGSSTEASAPTSNPASNPASTETSNPASTNTSHPDPVDTTSPAAQL